MGDHGVRRGVPHLVGGVVRRIGERGGAGGVVHQTGRRRVCDQVLLVGQAFVDDDLQHGQCERRVGAGPGLYPFLGLVGGLGIERVDGAQRAAVVHHLLDAPEVAAQRHDRVVAPGDDVVGVLELVARRLRAGAQDGGHACVDAGAAHVARRGGGAAQPGAERSHGAVQRAEVARPALDDDGLASAVVQRIVDLLFDEVDRLVPADLLELARPLGAHELERLGEALVGVAHLHARKALAAGRALVDFPALHLHQLAVAHIAFQQVMLAFGRAAAVNQLAVGERVLSRRRSLFGRLILRLRRTARKPHGGGSARRGCRGHERPARQRRHRLACRLLHRALLSSSCPFARSAWLPPPVCGTAWPDACVRRAVPLAP